MWLYQARLLKLEKELEHARKAVRTLQEDLENASQTDMGSAKASGGTQAKLRLDTVVVLLRLIKEQMAFYLKLGEKYDVLQLAEGIIDELSRRDGELCREILAVIDSKWEWDFPRGQS